MSKGWYGNRQAHMLSSRGIKTKCFDNKINPFPSHIDYEDVNIESVMYDYNKCVGEEAIYGARAYAGTRHYDMNHYLLTGQKTSEYVHNSEVMWNQEIMEKEIEKFKKYIDFAPKYTGEVWRGMGLDMDYPVDKELIEKIKHSLKTEEPLNFGTFLSTSVLYNNADNYIYGKDLPMMIRIHGGDNSGVYLGNAIFRAYDEDDDYNQNEVVFSPDVQFEIVNFKKEEYSFKTHNGYEEKDGYYLELEEI